MAQIIDDRDPAVVYSLGWGQGGVPREYNTTTTAADLPDQTATLVFRGSQVLVFGTVAVSNSRLPTRSSYSVDGSPPMLFQAAPNQSVQYGVQFYASPVLPNTQHALVVTHLGTTDTLFLDYFQIPTVDNDTPSSSSPSSSAVAKTSAEPFPYPTDPATSTIQKEPSSNNTGVIAGSVIGSAILIALIVIVILLMRRRKSREARTNPSTNLESRKPNVLDDPYRPVPSAPPAYDA